MSGSHERGSLKSRVAYRTRHLQQHPRLVLSTLLGIVVYFVLPAWIGQSPRLLASFDLAAIVFLAAIWIMMARATMARPEPGSPQSNTFARPAAAVWKAVSM